eukprot:CAMPEP_0185042622 /NCGR_PEP_ID=MMETSP1103-20130426/42458_1 /TAXON_ID=36769 /ORGANISM="Paraphysomonas bandaiensis, Strain Caron Lab Isolate" /LENGTH=69 /DNA_ID=CAMNT_0027582723 /DNA_START=288 /DNA_END=497 /DNA_ORIENTATION=-
MTHLRQGMTPQCLELLLFRRFNKHLWTAKTVQQGMTPQCLELLLFRRFNKHLWTAKTVQQVIDDGPSYI